jgi:hypothetical protein
MSGHALGFSLAESLLEEIYQESLLTLWDWDMGKKCCVQSLKLGIYYHQ